MWIGVKRRIFRAGVVAAVVWIGLTGWFEYANNPQDWIRLEGECWDRFAKQPDGKPFNNVFDIFDDSPASKAIWQKLGECEVAAEATLPIMQRVSLKASRVWSSLKDSLPVILLPPFVLLIVGYVIGWVVDGFRQNET